MKKTVKMYVKEVKNGKITFNVASIKLKDVWATVKFATETQVNLSNLAVGYHDVKFDTKYVSKSSRTFERADGTIGTEYTLWINDPATIVTIHERTAEEQAEIDGLFD